MSKTQKCGAEANVSIKRSEYGHEPLSAGHWRRSQVAVQIEVFRD